MNLRVLIEVRSTDFNTYNVSYMCRTDIDVRGWNDNDDFSLYKVCLHPIPSHHLLSIHGRSMACTLARCMHDTRASPLMHHSLSMQHTPYKLTLGRPSYKLVYECTVIPAYFHVLM